MIQCLENFVSMAIQGTQVPMCTNTHCFCIFLIFQNFILFYEKQNKKKKLKIDKQKHVKQIKRKHKTRCICMKAWFQKDKKSSKESPTLDRKN